LCSSECDVTGEIIAARAGYYTCIRLMKGECVVLSSDRPNTIVEFVAAKDRIFALSGAKPYSRTIDDATKTLLGSNSRC
jgi:hypothetical protein